MSNTPSSPFHDGDFLDYAISHRFGDLHLKVDPNTGMRAIIAIHNTKLGPALGGCRFIEYPNTTTAIYDAMRLARGMSYKAALVNLPLGGGKSVIIKPQGTFNRDAYFDRFGEFVQELGGRYITALDSGTLLSDMDRLALHTPYVASQSIHGDPSPSTVAGILRGIQAVALFKWNKISLDGLHMAIQGLGHVGYLLAGHLHALGVKLTLADINPEVTRTAATVFNATIVPTTTIHQIPCDIFIPCALGSILNDQSIPELQTTVVAGAANNQLAHTYHGQQLHDRGILYAPDYVINAGGLIYAASQYMHTPPEQFTERLEHIHTSLLDIFTRSHQENRPTSDIADALAEEKLQ